ncbi:natural cytotoxicity triggering receptor 3 isoform X3 [Peromyscus maniculatus bairdii]|uniref:natural cytotoxicity triggering receptor 3 isoform X3 n=1 Tax=Peromyscus maniculatus bairdii TaxID=230844 RepID=UPI003FD5B754
MHRCSKPQAVEVLGESYVSPACPRHQELAIPPQTSLMRSASPTTDMAKVLLLICIAVYPGSCALWVSQPPEIRAREGTTALLPCSFNASQGTVAIGSVMWYQEKVAPGMEGGGARPGHRNRKRFSAGGGESSPSPLPAAEPPQQASEQADHTSLLLRAGFYALSFLSVATGSTLYYQGKCPCHVGAHLRQPERSDF